MCAFGSCCDHRGDALRLPGRGVEVAAGRRAEAAARPLPARPVDPRPKRSAGTAHRHRRPARRGACRIYGRGRPQYGEHQGCLPCGDPRPGPGRRRAAGGRRQGGGYLAFCPSHHPGAADDRQSQPQPADRRHLQQMPGVELGDPGQHHRRRRHRHVFGEFRRQRALRGRPDRRQSGGGHPRLQPAGQAPEASGRHAGRRRSDDHPSQRVLQGPRRQRRGNGPAQCAAGPSSCRGTGPGRSLPGLWQPVLPESRRGAPAGGGQCRRLFEHLPQRFRRRPALRPPQGAAPGSPGRIQHGRRGRAGHPGGGRRPGVFPEGVRQRGLRGAAAGGLAAGG